jgi:hypothetical protein
VALAIGADGTKVPVGLWLGDTENKTVVTALLVARGLNTDGGLLVVIDGAKALAPRCARCSATPRSSSGHPAVHAAQAPQRPRPPPEGPTSVGRSQARRRVQPRRSREG